MRTRPNNLRTIFFIVVVVTAACYFALSYYNCEVPKTFAFATATILYPIAAMQKSREMLKSSTEMKDITTDEMARLRSITSKRASNILKTIIFYIFSAIATGVFVAANIDVPWASLLGASIISGILTAALYSTYAAHLESDEVTDFKSKIQERVNRKAHQEAFNKKILEASKNKG